MLEISERTPLDIAIVELVGVIGEAMVAIVHSPYVWGLAHGVPTRS
jgi:hypothetical protein